MRKKNIILFITTFVFTVAVFILFIVNMDNADAEIKNNPNSYWSTENHPIFYGTSKASIPNGETFDLKDARFRVFARDFEDGELTRDIQVVSNNVDTSIDGTYEVVYKAIDSHGNKTEFTQTIVVETGRTKINLERVVYTLPSADNIHKIGVYRADNQDRQILGIYLSKNATAQIRSIDSDTDLSIQYYANDSWKEGSNTIIPKNGDWVTLKNEFFVKDSDGKNTTEKTSGNSVPLLQTIMLNDANNSLTKTFKVEVEFDVIDESSRSNEGEVRRLKFYYYKDDYDAFKSDWNVPSEDYNKSKNTVDADDSSYVDSIIYDQFAVIDSYRVMIVADSWCFNKFQNYGANWFDTLDHHLEYYDKMIKRYNEILGLSLNPDKITDQNVESKNVVKPNAHGAGGAYYSNNHIGVNFPSDYSFFERNWGGLHEVGHGYQGPFGKGTQMNLGETSNNVLAVYVQRDKTIYQANGSWLGEMSDVEIPANQIRLDTHSWPTKDYLNHRLYILMNLFDALEGADTYAKMYSWYRDKVINEDYTRENHDAYVESLADIYQINIIPYMEAWGLNISEIVKSNVYAKNYRLFNILGDQVHDDNLTNYLTSTNTSLKYALVDNSKLKESGLTNDLTINISIDNIDKLIGKRIILKDGSSIIKNVDITSSSVTITNVPLGTYYLQMPVLDNYLSDSTYAVITDQVNIMSYTYTKAEDIDYTDYLTLAVKGTSNTYGYQIKFSDKYKMGTITLGLANMGNSTFYVKIYDDNNNLIEDDKTDYKHTDNKYYFHFDASNGKPAVKEVILDTGYVIEINRTEPSNKVDVLNTAGDKITEYNMTSTPTRYVLMDNGIKLESMTDEEAEETAYQVSKRNLVNTIEEYMDIATSSEIADKTKHSKIKTRVISAYNQLKEEDKTPYTEFIKKLIKGGVPTLTYTGKTTYDKSSNVDLMSLIKAIDSEDGNIDISTKNTTVTTSLDLNKNGVYTVKYSVTDSDGNTSTLEVDITVNNIEELVVEEEAKPVVNKTVKASPRTEETNTSSTTTTKIIEEENTTINEEITTVPIEKQDDKKENGESKKESKKQSKKMSEKTKKIITVVATSTILITGLSGIFYFLKIKIK